MDYQSIANWIGWPPIVALLTAVGGFGVWFYESRLKIQKEKVELLQQKLEDSNKLTSEALVIRLAETRESLTREIEYLSSQSKQDTRRIFELNQELEETNLQLKNQKAIINKVQELLAEMELPRDGKFRPDIESDILNTIRTQNCIYIPVSLSPLKSESNPANIKVNYPYKVEVVFPGMFKMYLVIYDNLDNRIGFVSNPYWGIYEKDYYVTLLHFLKHVPSEHIQGGYSYEGEVKVITQSQFHSVSPIDPNIIYLKIPFNESLDQGKA